jgi:hypothetical protein
MEGSLSPAFHNAQVLSFLRPGSPRSGRFTGLGPTFLPPPSLKGPTSIEQHGSYEAPDFSEPNSWSGCNYRGMYLASNLYKTLLRFTEVHRLKDRDEVTLSLQSVLTRPTCHNGGEGLVVLPPRGVRLAVLLFIPSPTCNSVLKTVHTCFNLL